MPRSRGLGSTRPGPKPIKQSGRGAACTNPELLIASSAVLYILTSLCDHIWVQGGDRIKVHGGKWEGTEWDRLKDTGVGVEGGCSSREQGKAKEGGVQQGLPEWGRN